ncbi:MAG: Metal binding domain of Ada, partial [Chlorobi bacterium OLB5]
MEMKYFQLPPAAEMKKAVYSKDKSYDGIFFVAVKSTNIFCRPACP